ncbi:DUF664 domain-containing protein [Segetibacter sp. 3557_3]|uniref:mycothiol transferase n=1 Tax=Segetibacter sp. 3557_3 TaxID=2547429 RepID=UPI0010583BBF|nr:DUF664 domain-containing protein [Segetibacter sp. 3557_3]TDH23438.1 DUF664 domain-containing protein [Segetibacter sp. 3557_3]
MKILLQFLLAVTITQLTWAQPAKKWTDEDRNTLTRLLSDTKVKLAEATKGLSERQLAFKPTDTSWSIKGVTEHLASYAEYYYWELVTTTRSALPQYLDSTRCADQHFMTLADTTEKHVATGLFLPRDKYGDFANTLKQYNLFKDAFLIFVKENQRNFREYFSVRPARGVFDCRWRDAHQVVLVEIAHVLRHLKQIDRIKNHPQFPKN